MRRAFLVLLFLTALCLPCAALEGETFGGDRALQALPEEATELLEGITPEAPGDLGGGIGRIFSGALDRSGGALGEGARLCGRILAVVLLSAVLRGTGTGKTDLAVDLAGILTVGAVCVGSVSGFFTRAARTVDALTTFGSFLYAALASASAAGGSVGTATALYGVTGLLCGLMAGAVRGLFLPGIASYMALMIGDSALGDGGLKTAADCLKLLLTQGLKLAVLGFTVYLSLTRVVSGTADTAAVRAARLTISTAVPVVGGIIADASETLLVSVSLIRSGLGVFGLLGALAVSLTPFLEIGAHYLMLKLTAAAAAVAGETKLAGLISAMSAAMGLLTGLTGAAAAMLMVGCVCFMRVGM